MKVLFIGGNGNISWWCVQKALDAGYEVYELNRSVTRSTRRAVQSGVIEIIADIRDFRGVKTKLSNQHFDVICDFICYDEYQAQSAIDLFTGLCEQYIVISSEAVYQRKSSFLPYKENTPHYELPIDDSYISGKIKMEKKFHEAFLQKGFPVTIVRPGYTYDTILRVPFGNNCFTAPQKYLQGYPFLIPGDGENLLAPLHSKDFADAFFYLIGNKKTIGEDYHITAEILLTMNEMAEQIMKALGCNKTNVVHIPRDEAFEITSFYSKTTNKQQMWHYIFDNSKIKSIVPSWRQSITFEEGIKMTISWLREDKKRQRINRDIEKKLMKLYETYN